MARFDANKNRAYQTYPETKPGYGGIAYPDYVNCRFIDGREAIVGFSATQNSHSYAATTEQVIQFKRFPAAEDHYKHGPTRKDLFKDHGARDKPVIGPWGPAHSPPEKARDFSHKFGNYQVIQAQNKGSQRNTHDHYGKYNNFSSDDDDSDDNHDDDDGVFYEKNNNNEKHKGGNNIHDPPSYTSNYETPYPNNGYSPPPSYNVPFTTPPPPTEDHPKYNVPKKSDIHLGYNNNEGYNNKETIDSAEARRRYGKASPQVGARVEEKYTVTIDSREAARKYNGVFVPA